MSSKRDVERAVKKIQFNFSKSAFAEEYSYCSVFVLSHGDSHDKISCGDNGSTFSFLYDVMNKIDLERCPHLKGRPLFFFVRACRGNNYNSCEGDHRSEMINLAGGSWTPLLPESYVLYSTPEGFNDSSSPVEGSKFIELLCQGIAERKDVEEIAKFINCEAALRIVGGRKSVLQTESSYGRLTKKFKFYF